MKLTLDEFKELCVANGFGLTLPVPDQERLFAALDQKLGWSKGESTQAFVKAYVNAWRARYKTSPIIDGKTAAAAKRIVTTLGAGPASELVEVYLEMGDSFFIARRHDMATFEHNLNQVKIYAEGHGTVTRHELNQADRLEGERGSWDRVKARLKAEKGQDDGQ